MRVVRRRLNQPLRTLYDSMDVTNEVFASLAFKCDKFEFDSLEKLMSFLANSAEQKIIDEYRRRSARSETSSSSGRSMPRSAMDTTSRRRSIPPQVRFSRLTNCFNESARRLPNRTDESSS